MPPVLGAVPHADRRGTCRITGTASDLMRYRHNIRRHHRPTYDISRCVRLANLVPRHLPRIPLLTFVLPFRHSVILRHLRVTFRAITISSATEPATAVRWVTARTYNISSYDWC